MKKRLFSIGLIAALGVTSVLMMTGCGDKTPYGDYDLSEYVKVGNYKNLEYKKEEASVSASEVQNEIQKRLKAAKEEKSVETGIVKDNDKVNIAFDGKVDGEPLEKGSSDSTNLTIGSGEMIPGFEDGLIGKKVGDTVTLNLTFPENYDKKLAGKDAVFTVKIKSKIVEVIPEYNLDFVKKQNYDSIKSYEAAVMKELLEKKQELADMDAKNELWKKIMDKSEILKYPEKEKEALIDSAMDGYKQTAADEGIEWKDYLKTLGISEETMRQKTAKFAEEKMFQEMVLYSIAEKEDVTVSDEEYDEFLNTLLDKAGLDADRFKSAYGVTIEEYAQQREYRMSLLLNKVLDKVMEYGKEIK